MTAKKREGVSFLDLLREYWRAYGGLAELKRSPYLLIALILMPLMAGSWLRPYWWHSVLSIIPGLLGISLAAFALLLGAGSEQFREALAGEETSDAQAVAGNTSNARDVVPVPAQTDHSPFLKAATVFLHFLVIQFITLIDALIAQSIYSLPAFHWFEQLNHVASILFWFVSYLLFIYSLSMVLAASFGVYEVVRWFDEYVTQKRRRN
jgi:hypothetical protein